MNFLKQILGFVGLSILLFSCTSPRNEAEQGNEIKTISDKNKNAHSVYLTKNHLEIPVMVWTEQDTTTNAEKHFFFALFDTIQKDFSEKIEIPIEQNAALHTEGMPKIAFKNSGEIIAVYEVKVESDFNPYAGEIHYIISKDNGINWSEPKIVHASKLPHKGRAFFDMIALADGEIGVSWLGESHPDGGRPVMFAKTNKANEFVNEVVVDSLACECCRTAIYSDKIGTISIVYRDIINDSIRDISVSISNNDGKTFSTPVCFSGDNWNINGCPHNGPDVVSDDKNIYATWFTGADDSGVYFAKLDKETLESEKTLISKNGRNIQVGISDEKAHIVYNESYNNNDKFYSKIRIVTHPDMTTKDISDENKIAHSPTVIIGKNKDIITGWLENNGKIDIVKYKIMNNKNAL